MKATTKYMSLGALGVLGAAGYGAARLIRKRRMARDIDQRFDLSDDDLDVPVVITEEVVVFEDPYTD